MDNMPVQFVIPRALGAILLIGIIFAITGQWVSMVRILLLVFAGSLLGVLFSFSEWLGAGSGISYRFAYLSLTACLIAVVALTFHYLGSPIIQQTGELGSQLQAAVQQGQKRFLISLINVFH